MKKQLNQIGLWMDHVHAKIIHPNGAIQEIKAEVIEKIPGESPTGARLGNFRSTNNENNTHNKERKLLHEYFEQVNEAIKPYDDIILFGPSTAPQEFHNYILKNMKNDARRFNVMKSDYLTDNQLVAFVSDYTSAS